MECEGVKPRVMETDDLPGTLSEEERMKVNEDKSLQKKAFQRDFDVAEKTETLQKTETGVLRFVVLPSPTCTRKQNTSSATKTFNLPHITQQPPSKTKQQASLGHKDCIPSMTPRRRWTAHRNVAANHSVTNTPSSAPHNSTSHITQPRTTTT
jgi:hypothetical protein